jgi:phosphomethylpyrimidine synthase
MTQLQKARQGKTTKEMKIVAKIEGIDIEILRKGICDGIMVIPANINHKKLRPIGIGKGMRIKVNANIGTSKTKSNPKTELKKLAVALDAGADTVMDLSTGSSLDRTRKMIVEKSYVPVGTVPIYQTAIEAGSIDGMTIDKYLKVLKKHAEDGIDFVTIHAGVTRKAFPLIETRMMKCVSRGGTFLLSWMKHNRKENFLYQYFDDVLDLAIDYDLTMSLGDGLRPGCIADATDKAQIDELKTLGELAHRARDKGVQVIIEGPGHIPLNEIEINIKLEKKYCDQAPFYVLGPLPTDIAAGYDHIACAIGGALAGMHGANFLCYVTPKEHVGLPDISDVREGVIVSRIAAHIADIANGNKAAIIQDNNMAQARAKVDWTGMQKFALDQERFAALRREECLKNPQLVNSHHCSMCGPFCVFEVFDDNTAKKKAHRQSTHKR